MALSTSTIQLRREGLRSSLSCFLDFALLTVGSLFTVGVADEDRDARL